MAAVVAVAASALLLASCSSTRTGAGAAARRATAPSTTSHTTTSQSTTSDTAPGSGIPVGVPTPSPGCGHSDVGPGIDVRRTITSSGVQRWYLLTVPPAHTGAAPLPLLLDFHGLTEGAEIHTRMSGFDQLAGPDGFVLATPNGTKDPVQWSVAATGNADVAFVDDLIDRLGQDLCLDLSRVYATGLSNGAMFSSVLACQQHGRVAAIAPVAGVLLPDWCQTTRPVPVLAVHGTADPILPFNGGVGDLGAMLSGQTDASHVSVPPADLDGAGYPENVRRWAAHNRCQAKPADSRPVTDVILRTYDCPADAAVEFYVVEGGGHSWPGSTFSRQVERVVGPTNMDLHASEVIWAFLSRFRMPTN